MALTYADIAANQLKILRARESLTVKACIQWLYHQGCDVVRCNTGSMKKSYTSKKTGITKDHYIRFGKPGMGDIIAISPHGRWLEVECKTMTGKQRDAQINRQREVERRKGVYILARSVDALEARKNDILAAVW